MDWSVVFAFAVALAIGTYFGFKIGVHSCFAYIQQQLLLAKFEKKKARGDDNA